MTSYIPERGDAVWCNFSPQQGREQAGLRPAIVLSPQEYNRKSGLLMGCPVTNRSKGYPFEVPIPQGLAVSGVILTDHLQSIDWRVRQVQFIGELPDTVLHQVLLKIKKLLIIE